MHVKARLFNISGTVMKLRGLDAGRLMRGRQVGAPPRTSFKSLLLQVSQALLMKIRTGRDTYACSSYRSLNSSV